MIDKEQALEIIDKRDFFNDRAGRELWSDKTKEIQDEDIKNAHEEYEQLKEYILNQPKAGEWIPVEEEFPKSRKSVLIYSKEGGVAEGEYDDQKGYFVQYRWNAKDIHVIAWRPLPEPYSSGD